MLPTWPTAQLPEALRLLARRSGHDPADSLSMHSPTAADAASLDHYIGAAAERVGFEAEPVLMPYAEFERTLPATLPALVRLPEAASSPFLLLVRSRGQYVYALGPDRAGRRLHPSEVRKVLCASLEASAAAPVNRLLDAARLPTSSPMRTALLREHLRHEPVEGVWLLRLPPSAPFFKQVQQTGLVRRLGGIVALHTAQYLLWLLAWWTIGRAALQGRFDAGWLVAWLLLLLTLVPLQLWVAWLQGHLSIHAGTLLKRRLLLGVLRSRLEAVRQQGVGQLLGRVIESEAVEALALSGGFLSFLALIELGLAGFVLALGAGGLLHVGVLIFWTTLTAWLGWRYYQRQEAWTKERLTLTDHLVERMVGHRTRLAQQRRDRWHTAEDREVAHYLETVGAMDLTAARLTALVPRGWLLLGFVAFAPAFVGGQQVTALAVSLGGMLLAYQAFSRLTQGVAHLTQAAIAWKQVTELFQAAASAGPPGRSDVMPVAAARRGETLLEAHGLTFRYAPGQAAVLREARLTVHAHDRLLLEGPSGGGKSTLASLLTGLRHPEAGLLLFRGLDQQTLGLDGWRRRIVAAPQFHENLVFTGTLAFNLLMGRRWPPSPDDLAEAERLCRALGLGDLLDRMPAGLMQMVGETGWQLSHGERSRLFLARALLQKADLVILDESFGALDPENRVRAMQCALDHAPALMVIAHP